MEETIVVPEGARRADLIALAARALAELEKYNPEEAGKIHREWAETCQITENGQTPK